MPTEVHHNIESQRRASKLLFVAFAMYVVANVVLATLATQLGFSDQLLLLVIFVGLGPSLVPFITLFVHFGTGGCFRPGAVVAIVGLSLVMAVVNYLLIGATMAASPPT